MLSYHNPLLASIIIYNLFIDFFFFKNYNFFTCYIIYEGDNVKIKAFFKEHPLVFSIIYTIIYFTWFIYLEENLTPRYVISSPVDDFIPFCEYFIIPYLLWFFFIPCTLFALMFFDRDSFWKMVAMMFIGNLICLLLYSLFPNSVETKHLVSNENFFCKLVNILYHTDTPTNVCPSIHVLDTFAAHIALSRSRLSEKHTWLKGFSGVFLVLICIATVTLKQHSIIDVFASFVLIFFLEKLAYSKLPQRKPKTITSP